MAGPGHSGDMRDAWLDLLHGARCVGCQRPGRVLCPACHASLPDTSAPARPDPCPSGLRPCRVAGDYAGLIRQLVLGHKERRQFGLAAPLGELLAAAIGPMLTHPAMLVPVPTRRLLVRTRGHDPTARLARAAARLLRNCGHDVVVQPLLTHRLPVLDQAGLSSTQRARNRTDTLVLRPAWRSALARSGTGRQVIVCDDVLTTGATVREAQRALVDAGIDVAAIACVAATRRRVPGPDQHRSLPFSPPTN